jgi:hypothetical protein
MKTNEIKSEFFFYLQAVPKSGRCQDLSMNSQSDQKNIGETEMISTSEAAHILGFKQTLPIMNYVKKGYLTAYTTNANNRRFFLRQDILNFPTPLPIPPPPEKFKGHGRPG